MKISYIRELDGTRGTAALMVMFYHFFFRFGPEGEFLSAMKKLTHFGQSGVSLFFVLSGFLITRILLSTKQNEHYFSHFYLRRSLRIFPLYYLFLVFTYFLFPLLENGSVNSSFAQAFYWVYLQDFAVTFNWHSDGPYHFWSLAVEEHFYLFWPLMVYCFNNKKIAYAIGVIIITALLTRWLLIANHYEYRYFTFSRMDELAMGAFLAILEAKGKLAPVKQNARRFLVLLIISTVPVLLFWSSLTSKAASPFFQLTRFLFLGFAYFSFIGFVITASNKLFIKTMLRTPFFTYTGKISYGLYVYHPLCFWLAAKLAATAPVAMGLVLSFVCSYIVASLSYYLFEKKFLGFKKYFEYKSPRRTVAIDLTPATPTGIANAES